MAARNADPSLRWKILIIDDSPSSLQMLAEILLRQGYEVHTVSSGREALREAEALRPDLILLDVVMPEMNGFEVCEALKKKETFQDTPVIFLNEAKEIIKGFEAGGVDYVTKPFQVKEVKARVEAHLKIRELQLELASHNRHQEDMAQENARELIDSQMSTIFALAMLAESRDDATGRHLETIRVYGRRLAAALLVSLQFSLPAYAQESIAGASKTWTVPQKERPCTTSASSAFRTGSSSSRESSPSMNSRS